MLKQFLALLGGVSAGWSLGPYDVRQWPEATSRLRPVRIAIEREMDAVPYFERPAHARRMFIATRGFEREVWRSYAPGWQVLDEHPEAIAVPLGVDPTTRDPEVLRVRLLTDYGRLQGRAYRRLLYRLLANDPDDVRLLRVAAYSSTLIGGRIERGLGYAQRVLALRPEDPNSWRLMASASHARCRHIEADRKQSYRMYLDWSERFAVYARAHADRHDAARNFLRSKVSRDEWITRIVYPPFIGPVRPAQKRTNVLKSQ